MASAGIDAVEADERAALLLKQRKARRKLDMIRLWVSMGGLEECYGWHTEIPKKY